MTRRRTTAGVRQLGIGLAGAQRGAGVVDDLAGLAHRFRAVLRALHDLLDLRHVARDLGDERLDFLGVLLRGFALAPFDEVLVAAGRHLLDLVLGQARGRGDSDRLLLAGFEVLGGDGDDAVGVDLEGDLDFHLALRRAAEAGEHDLAEQLVLLGLLALALEDHEPVLTSFVAGLACPTPSGLAHPWTSAAGSVRMRSRERGPGTALQGRGVGGSSTVVMAPARRSFPLPSRRRWASIIAWRLGRVTPTSKVWAAASGANMTDDYFRRDGSRGISPPDVGKECSFAEHIVRARGKRTKFTSVSLDPEKIREFGDTLYLLLRELLSEKGHLLVEHLPLMETLRREAHEGASGVKDVALRALRRAKKRKEGLVDWRFDTSGVERKDVLGWAVDQVQAFFSKR